jgi:cyclic pyranopterin phosphate synthase
MPEEGIDLAEREEVLSYEEITRLSRVFAAHGVNKIRLTGGEPTIRKGIVGLIKSLSQIDGIDSVALTTNGSTLEKQAAEFKAAGLCALNVSLDTLHKDRFAEVTGRDEFDRVMRGIDAALEAGIAPVKVNVVAMKGFNDDEFADFVAFTKDRPIHVRFIEFMPFAGNQWSQDRIVPFETMLTSIREKFDLQAQDRAHDHVSKDYVVPGHAGKVGFITSMTEDFCSGCSRIRLTALGELKTCLFFQPEMSLRDAMRGGASDEELAKLISDTVLKKRAGHPDLQRIVQVSRTSMVAIGG